MLPQVTSPGSGGRRGRRASVRVRAIAAWAADAVALGVFAGLDGHHVVPGGEPAGEQRAALAGVGVPAGDGSFSIVAEAAAAGKVKNWLVPCTNPGIPPVGLDTAILANFCRSFG